MTGWNIVGSILRGENGNTRGRTWYWEGKTEILRAEPDTERGKQKYSGQNLILRGENRNTRGTWTRPASNPGLRSASSSAKRVEPPTSPCIALCSNSHIPKPYLRMIHDPYYVIRHCINFCFERKQLNYSDWTRTVNDLKLRHCDYVPPNKIVFATTQTDFMRTVATKWF